MTKFSANLGFLWTELELPKAIVAAHDAGFEAVECHFPYDVPAADVRRAADGSPDECAGVSRRAHRERSHENGEAQGPRPTSSCSHSMSPCR